MSGSGKGWVGESVVGQFEREGLSQGMQELAGSNLDPVAWCHGGRVLAVVVGLVLVNGVGHDGRGERVEVYGTTFA